DRKSTRLNSSHTVISYAVFCLKKKRRGEQAFIRGVREGGWRVTCAWLCRLRAGPPRPTHVARTNLRPTERSLSLFFFNDTATPEISPLPLHDALPISSRDAPIRAHRRMGAPPGWGGAPIRRCRSEEHTSELQSRQYLVCRLLLEKKQADGTPNEARATTTPPRLRSRG